MASKFWRFLVWLDRQVNDKLLHGRFETISSRCYRRQATRSCRFCTWLCKMLHAIDPDHCKNSYFNDRLRNPTLPWV